MDMPQSKRNENRYFYGTEGQRVVNRLGGVSDLIRLGLAKVNTSMCQASQRLISFVDAVPPPEVKVSSAAGEAS